MNPSWNVLSFLWIDPTSKNMNLCESEQEIVSICDQNALSGTTDYSTETNSEFNK